MRNLGRIFLFFFFLQSFSLVHAQVNAPRVTLYQTRADLLKYYPPQALKRQGISRIYIEDDLKAKKPGKRFRVWMKKARALGIELAPLPHPSERVLAIEKHAFPETEREWKQLSGYPKLAARSNLWLANFTSVNWASVVHAVSRGYQMKAADLFYGYHGITGHALINLMYFRAFSDQPHEYILAPRLKKEQRMFQSLSFAEMRKRLVQYHQGTIVRPKAQVVYYYPKDKWRSPAYVEATEILPPVVQFLTALGYEVSVNLDGQWQPKADIYYLITPGGELKPPADWLQLLENSGKRKSVVFFQAWRGFGLEEPWRSIRKTLGISLARPIAAAEGLPRSVIYQKQRFLYRGWGRNPAFSSILSKADLVSAYTRIYVAMPAWERALVVFARGNNYFINGNLLNAELGFLLSDLVGPYGRWPKPHGALYVPGKTSALFALRSMKFELKAKSAGTRFRVSRRDPETGYESSGVLSGALKHSIDLKRYEFAFIEKL